MGAEKDQNGDSEVQNGDPREPFWNINKEDRVRFSVIFFVLFCVELVIVFLYHYVYQECETRDDIVKSFVVLGKSFVYLGISAFMATFFLHEGREAMGLAKGIALSMVEKAKAKIAQRKEEQFIHGRQSLLNQILKEDPDFDIERYQPVLRQAEIAESHNVNLVAEILMYLEEHSNTVTGVPLPSLNYPVADIEYHLEIMSERKFIEVVGFSPDSNLKYWKVTGRGRMYLRQLKADYPHVFKSQ